MCKYKYNKFIPEKEREIVIEYFRGKGPTELGEIYNLHRSSVSRLIKHVRECFPKLYIKLQSKANELTSYDKEESFIMYFDD